MKPTSATVSTISTFQQTGEDLGFRILHGPSAIGDLLLHLPEHIRVDDRLVGIFYAEPILRGPVQPLFVLVRYGSLLAVDTVADVGFVLQNVADH